MAILLFGIGKTEKIDRWLKADNSAIEDLKRKVTQFADNITRNPSLTDYIMMVAIAFTSVGLLTGAQIAFLAI